MTTMTPSPREQGTIFEIGRDRYQVVEDIGEIVRGLPQGLRRSWEVEPIALQNAEDDREFEIPLRTFDLGSGFSFADADGVYEQANGWDASARGRLTTWARLTTGASTTSVDARGYEIFHADHLYVMRGRYSTKMAVQQTTSTWVAIERFDFGTLDTNCVVAGKPVAFQGDVYVPLMNSATRALHEWIRLSTVNTQVVETQVLTVGGTPTTGTWTATYGGATSGTIAIDAAAATVQTTLRLLPGLSDVTVARSGSSPNYVYTVTMTGAGGVAGGASPAQMTAADTFDTGQVTPTTTVAGTSDLWERGPTHATTNGARCFTVWQHPISGPVLVRGAANIVELCATSPLVDANWETEYEVGDTGSDVLELGSYDRDLVAWKSDGRLYTFDPQANAIPVADVIGNGGTEEGINLRNWFGHTFIPTLAGLWRWRPGAARKVGAEQEGALDGTRSSGWGKVMGQAPHGDRLYYVAQDNYHEKGIVGSFGPKPRSNDNPITPHTHFLLDVPVEDCELLRLTTEPGVARTLSTWTDDAAVGTTSWTAPTEAVTVDVGGTNLIPNPGAEVDTTGWAAFKAGVSVTRETTDPKEGSAHFQIVTPGTVTQEGLTTTPYTGDIPIIPGAKYTLCAYVKVTSGTATLQLQAIYYTATGGTLISSSETPFTATTTYQRVTLPFTAPATATVLTIRIDTVTTAQAKTIRVDGVELLDGKYAYTTAVGTTHYLKGVAVSGTVPTGATILGIQVDVFRRMADLSATAASIVDNSVRLVQAGSVAGDNKADAATQWTTSFAAKTYGGPNQLWGLTWTSADFASTFGIAHSAVVTQGQAQIDGGYVYVYYETAGSSDPGVMLAVLTLDATRTIATPYIYQLPRAGLTASNDPLVAKLDAAETPELEIWASVDDGDDFQLYEDAEATTPAVATFTSTGFKRAFFPVTSASVGRYVQLVLKAGDREFRCSRYVNPGREIQKTYRAVECYLEASLSQGVTVRDLTLRGSYRVDNGLQHTIVVKLQQDHRYRDGGQERRTVEQQKADVIALNGRNAAPVPFRLGDGSEGYCEVVSAQLREVDFKGESASTWIAVIKLREAPYG